MGLASKIILSVITAAGLLSGCLNNSQKETTLTVFAAASLTEAFNQIGTEFTSGHPGVKIYFNFAGSQQLAQQIAQKAPADIFASADQKAMQDVVDSGEVEAGTARIFASNRLVVVCAPDNPSGLQDFSDLANPGLRLLIAAENVPVGRYSRQALEKAASLAGYPPDFAALVLDQVVSFEDSVRAVLTKVSLGEADAGIVYQSDLSNANAAALHRVEIPDEANVLAVYPIAIIQDNAAPGAAQQFVDFVLSNPGQIILSEFGFGPIPE